MNYFEEISKIHARGVAERAEIEHNTERRIHEIEVESARQRAALETEYARRGEIIDQIGVAAESGNIDEMTVLLEKLTGKPVKNYMGA